MKVIASLNKCVGSFGLWPPVLSWRLRLLSLSLLLFHMPVKRWTACHIVAGWLLRQGGDGESPAPASSMMVGGRRADGRVPPIAWWWLRGILSRPRNGGG
jgi:hypothetical protein